MQCPKCGADAAQTHERTPGTDRIHHTADGTPRPPTIDEILGDRGVAVFGTEFDVLYRCETHGEFGVKPGGVPEFVEPDIWVKGPNGEKLFRM